MALLDLPIIFAKLLPHYTSSLYILQYSAFLLLRETEEHHDTVCKEYNLCVVLAVHRFVSSFP